MHGGQGARARALLRLGRAGPVRAFGTGQDAARGEEEDLSVRELLLELAGEAVKGYQCCGGGVPDVGCVLPLLDFVESAEEGDGDEDDDGFFAVADLELGGVFEVSITFFLWLGGFSCPEDNGPYLTSGHELQGPERALHVGDVGLQVVDRAGDAGLQLGGVLPRGARGRDLVDVSHDCGALVVVEGRETGLVVVVGVCNCGYCGCSLEWDARRMEARG